jgi:hypothetical protein
MENDDILNTYPRLRAMNEAPSMQEYLEPILGWKPDSEVFPQAARLTAIITDKAAQLYGGEAAALLQAQLANHAHIDTGPHLHLPRDLDRTSQNTPPHQNMNTLIVQSIGMMAGLYADRGLPVKLNMFTGIVPSTNSNSGSHFQVSSDPAKLVRLVPDRTKQCVQAYLPAMSQSTLDNVAKSASGLEQPDRTRVEHVLSIWTEQKGSFSDQIAAASSYLYNDVQGNSGVNQLNMDFQALGTDYLVGLLEDETTVVSRIFSYPNTAESFAKDFSGIATGWKEGEKPFVRLRAKTADESGAEAHSADGNYDGSCLRADLIDGLRSKKIMPTNAMLHFAVMVEGGMLATGGMFQSEYCTEIRDRAVPLLNEMGEHRRAEALQKMPTDKAVVTPVWGFKDGEPLNYGALLRMSLTRENFSDILRLSGADVLSGAVPCLAALRGQTAEKHPVRGLDFTQ